MIKNIFLLVSTLFLIFIIGTNTSIVNAAPSVCLACPKPVRQGCGANGCSPTKNRKCSCTGCGACSGICVSWSCSCVNDTSCAGSSCTPDCTGKNCGDNGCGGSCGTCASGVCDAGTCCSEIAPDMPTLISPADGAQLRLNQGMTFSWNPVSSWGTSCTVQNNRYYICVGDNPTDCNYYSNWNGTNTTLAFTPTIKDTTGYWAVAANNGSVESGSERRTFCVEGFDATNTSYVSSWSSCDPVTNQRTRTCIEDCGTDDCTLFESSHQLTQSCLGSVRGTLFDASNYNSCPAFDPGTGYLIGLQPGEGIANTTFAFSDQSSTPPHPYPPLSAPITDGNGNYNISVYAPATYLYGFSGIGSNFITSKGPKLICQASFATVPANDPSCEIQPCSIVNNMSFGFWRIYGGWWQAIGGNVHGEKGIKSAIPASLTTEMSLILPDTLNNNRLGFLSYGVTRATDMLGTNPNAKVSSKLWEKQSTYNGPIYDYGYYNTRFNLFPSTVWSENQTITYDDGGNGYEIFKSNSGVSNFDISPTGTQKMIFLINGDVRVTGNITVPKGAFLAVIASGNIIFDQSVTRVDGWFVAGNISVPCTDVDGNGCDKTDSKFAGNGTFIGWNGISLSRDRGIANNTEAPELFTYRQDMYANAPTPMKLFTKYYKPFIP